MEPAFSTFLSLSVRSFRGSAISVPVHSRCGALVRRIRPVGPVRAGARMCAENTNTSISDEPRVVSGEYDELKSDEDYIVVDGKDVEALIEAMQQSGEDALLALDDFEPNTDTDSDTQGKGEKEDKEKEDEIPVNVEPVMEYFTEQNLSHMPKWAREAYKSGNHSELEEASRLMEKKSLRRLHALADAQDSGAATGTASSGNTSNTSDNTSCGISECRVCDVAEDYDVPVEFVGDVLLELGVKSPRVDDAISSRCNREEIGTLLHLISSFDAKDLSDRYSDSTLAELADDYDLDLDTITQLCADEQIYCIKEEDTRLQVTREDRILDILMKDSPMKKPYPSLLEGLFASAA